MAPKDAEALFNEDDAPGANLAFEKYKRDVRGGTFTPEQGVLDTLVALHHIESLLIKRIDGLLDTVAAQQEVINTMAKELGASTDD